MDLHSNSKCQRSIGQHIDSAQTRLYMHISKDNYIGFCVNYLLTDIPEPLIKLSTVPLPHCAIVLLSHCPAVGGILIMQSAAAAASMQKLLFDQLSAN